MATRTVVNEIKMQGYTSDEKPRASDGSGYHVLDTGAQFVSHEGVWVPDNRMAYAVKMAAFI